MAGSSSATKPAHGPAAVFLAPPGKAAGADPLQLHREHQDQQDREPEVGHRDAELAERHHADVAGLVLARRRVDAQRDADQHREGHRHRGQRQRDLQPLGDQGGRRRVVRVALRSAALQQTADPVAVALQRGPIEAELALERGDRFRRRGVAEDHLRHVARQHVEHREHHQRRHRQRGHEGGDALQQKDAHPLTRPPAPAASPGLIPRTRPCGAGTTARASRSTRCEASDYHARKPFADFAWGAVAVLCPARIGVERPWNRSTSTPAPSSSAGFGKVHRSAARCRS
jgi:hypothetical protein